MTLIPSSSYDSRNGHSYLGFAWQCVSKATGRQSRESVMKAAYRLTLDRLADYQIRIPGQLDVSWSDWAGGMAITHEVGAGGQPVTTLTGALDQAALQGLLRRLYSMGLPIISVNCVAWGSDSGPQVDPCN